MPETNPPQGYLRVIVRTAGGNLPVPNAGVRISRAGSPDQQRITDENGMTEKIALPAPAPEESQNAERQTPFYAYQVEVRKPGFYTQFTENVPVFPGITSLQSVNLIGISEFNSGTVFPAEDLITVPENPQVLDTHGRDKEGS